MSRWVFRIFIALVLTAIYLYGFPSATITYGALDLLHVGAGVIFCVLLIPFFLRVLRNETVAARFGWVFLAGGGILGIILIFIGTPHRFKNWLYAHIALCVIGALLIVTSWLNLRGWLGAGF